MMIKALRFHISITLILLAFFGVQFVYAKTYTPAKPGTSAAVKIPPKKYSMHPTAKILVPSNTLVIHNKKTAIDQARWRVYKKAMTKHLVDGGAKLSPARYQRFVQRISKKANSVLGRSGLTLKDWPVKVIEGGRANSVNAFAGVGGMIMIHRPTVDLAFQLARIYEGAGGNREKLDLGIHQLINYRKNKGKAPEALKRPLNKKIYQTAESVIAFIVGHEMGHAAHGHLAIPNQRIWLPNAKKPTQVALTKYSRHREWQADKFGLAVGSAIAPNKAALSLFSYYSFLSNPKFDPKAKDALKQTNTHPLSFKRFNAIRNGVAKMGKGLEAKMPAKIEKKIWLPNN